MDKVSTDPPPFSSRGNLRALARGRRQNQVRHRWRVAEAARLVAVERLSYKEAAKRLGVSYGHFVGRLWPQAEQLTSSDYWGKEERECISMFVVESLHAVLQESTGKVTESAAYGMAAVNAAKTLMEIFGISFRQTPTGGGFPDADEGVDPYSSLLAGKQHLIDAIKARQTRNDKA